MEAAKKNIFLVARPFFVKPTTDIEKTIIHMIVGLKEPYFLPNIATNLLKNYDFANRQNNLTGS